MSMRKCPKCGTTEIDSGWIMSAGKVVYKSDTQRYFSAGGGCKTYVCTNCGYAESYVDLEYLHKIKSK